jgi:hypothetical protein
MIFVSDEPQWVMAETMLIRRLGVGALLDGRVEVWMR